MATATKPAKKVYLVTDPQPRSQVGLGDFEAHTDTPKGYGHMFAAVTGKSHFHALGRCVNNGLPFGEHGQHRILWDEFKDRDGKPHDVTLNGGAVVRQLICPQEVLDQKTRMEGQMSTEMCSRLLSDEQMKARAAASELSSRQVTELTLGEEEITRQPSESEQMPPKSVNGWTPERRAAAGAKLAQARALKAAAKLQTQPAT